MVRGRTTAPARLASREIEQQSKNHYGNQRHRNIKQDPSQPRRAACSPVVQLGTLGNADLIEMLEIERELAGARVAILGLAFESPIDNFLQLRRDRGIDLAG